MSNQHVLKIHPAPLADLLSGAKTAEVRRNDRGFQVGDTVRLMEVNLETGNWTGADDHVRTISHIQTGYGLPEGMCVLSYAQAEQQEAPDAQLDKDARIALLERELDRTRDRADMAEVELQHARAALASQPAALPTDPASWPLKVGADEFVSQQAKWPDTDPSDFMHDALYEMIRALNKPAVRGAEHE